MSEINIGDRVRIFETVSGNEYGEYGTVEAFEDGRYHVRAVDGALFSQTPDGVRLVQSRPDNSIPSVVVRNDRLVVVPRK